MSSNSRTIAYEIYRAKNGKYGKIPGVLGRSEFGLEVVIAVSFQVHVLDMSFGQVCQLMGFLLQLKLKKSQVDALLTRLARHWEGEFERLCTLVANSAIVHADETSWSLNSVWAILSEKARIMLHGVHKDAATLEQILDPLPPRGPRRLRPPQQRAAVEPLRPDVAATRARDRPLRQQHERVDGSVRHNADAGEGTPRRRVGLSRSRLPPSRRRRLAPDGDVPKSAGACGWAVNDLDFGYEP